MDSIGQISSTMNEAADGISDITGKTSEMVTDTANTSDKSGECKNYVDNLNDVVGRFTI